MAREQAIPGRLSFDQLFRSKRLIFRALENSPEHTAFIRDLMADDPESYAQSTNRLLVPLTVDDVEHDVEGLAKCLLAAVICLVPEKVDTEESEDDDEHEHSPGPSEAGHSTTRHGLTAIGWLTLDCHALTRHHRSCTLGIMIASAHQGEGYGTEAINWALDWAFRVAGMHAVRLSCFSFNERAVKLYQRLGFVREGVAREAYYFDGVWYNRILFSMLEREWAVVRGVGKDQ
ncbi:hypothetical protein VMCG_05926 [Cytospora schulzeri]|uniref:N-acetyltransferase domain-containing protein n=1 Tax=Cytospora schulzeri TaxID=448051 RepID=A0A423WD62_9PEZI|nr:hypothetical protein VMCG_05926 [Valsa malicola]